MTDSAVDNNQDQSALKRALFALKDMRTKLEEIEKVKTEPIAVVGMACRIPGEVNTPEEFWNLLHEGREGVGDIPEGRWDVESFYSPDPDVPGKMISRRGGFLKNIDQFDPQFFGISPREATTIDPQQRLLLETSWEALENSGYSPAKLAGSQTGVFVGVSSSEYLQFNMTIDNVESIDPYVGTGGMFSVTAGRVAYALGLHGPTMAVDTACSSSLVTIYMACQSLRNRQCDMALAGGVNIILMPVGNIYLSKMNAISPDGRCKTFSANANGFVRGEGCGMVTLKRLSDAQADGDNILAVIRGAAINHDGRSSGLTVPNGLAQQAVIELALADAGGIEPNQVSYVETHGTGTPLGDPIEVRALAAALCKDRPKDHPLMLGSVKTNIGHLESAAGIAAFMKTVLALHHQEIPPHLHLDGLNPHINWDSLPITIPTEPTPWLTDGSPRRAGVSAFGFSGTNAHVVLEEAPPRVDAKATETERPVHVTSLSARTEIALQQLAQRYAGYLETHPDAALGDIGFTTNTGRAPFAYRAAVVANSREQLHDKLAALASGQIESGVKNGWTNEDEQAKIAFLFTGQGSQYIGMGRQLYETQPVFRAALDQCAALLQNELEQPLLSVIYPDDETSKLLNETQYTQPALFALEYALAMLWQSWGIIPAAVMGHSVGEYVAATVAGVFSLEDGLKLIAARGRLMGALPTGGRMSAIFTDEQRVKDALRGYEKSVSIAAVNTPGQIVISGVGADIQEIVAKFDAEGVKTRQLVVSHAFHSPLMEPMLNAFEQIASKIHYSAPQIRLISNVTGQVAGPEIATAQYWRKHVREAVQFSKAISTLDQLNYDLYLEVGPGTTLLGMGQQCLPEKPYSWLPSLRKGRDDWEQLAEGLGELFIRGVEVDWTAFDQGYGRKRISLPTYPFQRSAYWSNKSASKLKSSRRTHAVIDEHAHPLLGQRIQSASRDILFENEISIDRLPFLNDHRVYGSAVVPGTAYMEIGLAAAREVFGTGQYSLENLSVHEPLILDDNSAQIVQVIVNTEGAGRGSFQIFSQIDDGSSPANWKLHAKGDIEVTQNPSAHSAPSLEVVQSSFDKAVALDGYYEHLNLTGLEYGPAFQGMKQLWHKQGEALGYTQLDFQPGEVNAYQLHPALLDTTMHPLDGALNEDVYETKDGIFLPVGLKRLTLYRPLGEAAWSHVIVHGQDGSKEIGESFTADIHIYDNNGQLAAEIESMYFKRAARESLRRALEQRFDNWLYEVAWHSKPLAWTDTRDTERWLILADRGGVGEHLAAQLAQYGRTADVVFADGSGTAQGTLDFSQPESFERLLSSTPYDGIVHAWTLDADLSDLDAAQMLGTASVLHTVQALAKANLEGASRLWLLTQNAQAGNAAQASVWGLGRVIGNEHPEIWGGLVDLQGSHEQFDLLAQHLLAADGETQAVLRDGERLVARLATLTDPPETLKIEPGQPFELDISQRGILENLILRPVSRRTPGQGEVEVQVLATGLNFRDVLNALGMYPGNAGALGTECAGVVVNVGEGVENIAVGDEVIVLAGGTFRSHVIASADLVFPKPANLTMAEAVSLPTTFLTAYYGFYRLANMKAGDRVLIHAAAGGVGLAAVQLALRSGAEIFGTAGSTEKREFLKSIGVHHVLNSRTLDFADEIMTITEGQGVNIVLNSLAGEFIPKSLSVLADGGYFLEIGKQGVWSQEQVSALNPTLTSTVYDLAQILYTDPGVIQADLLALLDDASAGHIQPLPIKTFPMQSVIEAFRFMAQAKHIGKVVITQENSAAIRSDASYLITGGLGGLGLKVAQRFVEDGARYLVLTGRRAPSDATQQILNTLRQNGAEIVVAQGDVSNGEDVSHILEHIQQNMPPLRGVIHAAGVIEDGVLRQQNWAGFERVLAPKVWGSWNLHMLTESLPLDFFVMFSSAASVMGSAGQGNYAAANAFMDALAVHRRTQGLPGLSINWGGWSEVGMASSMDSRQQQRLIAQGMNLIAPEQGLTVLKQLMEENRTQIMVMPINWSKLLNQLKTVPPLLEEFTQHLRKQTQTTAEVDFLKQLSLTAPDKRYDTLLAFVRDQVVKVLGLNAAQAPGLNQGLIEIGMDSLMAVELSNRFRMNFHQPFPATLAFEHSTIQALTNYLSETVLSQVLSKTDGTATLPVDNLDVENANAAELLSNLDNLSDEQVDLLLRQMQADQRGNP